jgi:hypothetical protein
MTTSQILLGLLTITMSGVVAAAVTYKLNSSRDEKRFRRQRLEEVFTSFQGFVIDLSKNWIAYTNVMTGKLDYNQALDLVIEQDKGTPTHFQKLEMVVTLYWPELMSFMDRLKVLRDKGGDILHAHKQRYLAGQITDKEAFDAIGMVIVALETLEKEFAEAAKRLAVGLRGAG